MSLLSIAINAGQKPRIIAMFLVALLTIITLNGCVVLVYSRPSRNTQMIIKKDLRSAPGKEIFPHKNKNKIVK